MAFDGIRNPELKKAVADFRQLRKAYQAEERKLAKGYRRKMLPEEERKDLEDAMFSSENFEKILSTDTLIRMKGDMMIEMIASENKLYNFNQSILKRLGGDYDIKLLYTGKCLSCGLIVKDEISHDKPVLDYKFADERASFAEHVLCPECGEFTEPVRTFNLFELHGDNKYHARFTGARTKSEARIIPKTVEQCAGRQNDIRDVYGFMSACETEEDCKSMLELLVGYHKNGKEKISCKDYFEVKESEKSGKACLENVRYFFYVDKKGRPRKQYIDEPLEMKVRSIKDSRGQTKTAIYRGIHTPIDYNGTVIEAQLKDVSQYRNEQDPRSPLFHENYAKQRGRAGIYHEQFSEMNLRRNWGEFEKRLERFLMESGIFGSHNPNLYPMEAGLYQK